MTKKKMAKKKISSPRALIGGSSEFLDSVIENIPHMVFVKDAKELRFVRFNRAGEELLGYSKKHMIGKNDYDFFPKSEADFFTKKDRQVLESRELYDIPQEPIHTKKKGIRILHTKKIPLLDHNGKPAYLLGISEDITERLRLEREIAAISDREQRRIGQDLHDGLGQHLTGVAFLSKGMAQKLASRNLSEAEEALQIAELVNQAIVVTRNVARILNPIKLDQGGLLPALTELASSTERLFKVRCRIDAPIPLQISDKNTSTHLYRIVQEAVDNAIKHGQASNVVITFSKSNDQINMSIKDNGLGLSNEIGKTQGMGLSNMEYRAKMIGGHLKMSSDSGNGTTVTCLFPSRMN